MLRRTKRKRQNSRIAPKRGIRRADLYEVVKLMFVIALSVMVLYGMNVAKKIPVEKVEIRSQLMNVKPTFIKEAVSRYIHAGFFQTEINQLENELEEIPWVYRAHVKRAWPDRLVVSIQEQDAVFRWGTSELLNHEGGRFEVQDVSAYRHLPELSGASGREVYLAGLFQRYSPRFARQNMLLKGIHEDARHNKVLVFASGMSIQVGSQEVDERLNQYLKASMSLSQEMREKIARVDLRHANGFAIQWNS